jgi:hypothetical protein
MTSVTALIRWTTATGTRRAIECIACVVLLAAPPLSAQTPDTVRIAAVDLFGLRTLPESAARRALGLVPGALIPDSAARAAAIARLSALPGVRGARVELVCCASEGGALVYVGVEESGAPTMGFSAAPAGAIRLPAEIVAAGAAFDSAFDDAVAHRDFAETDTAGYALMHWPAAAAVQRRFLTLAARDSAALRAVLHQSRDAGQRALAAQVLGYAPDKRAAVADLAAALSDPDGVVRNNATRALWVIAMYAQRHPALGVRVPYERLVGMLDSPVWTDRNKASLALAQLSTSRDPRLLALLRDRSMPSLVEMARWHELGHAGAALMMLGRIAGMSDPDITAALAKGDREAIIRAVEGPRQRIKPIHQPGDSRLGERRSGESARRHACAADHGRSADLPAGGSLRARA